MKRKKGARTTGCGVGEMSNAFDKKRSDGAKKEKRCRKRPSLDLEKMQVNLFDFHKGIKYR